MADVPVAPVRQMQTRIDVATDGAGFTDILPPIADWLAGIVALDGLVTVFIAHTSASLTIQENTDATVRADLADALARLAPEGPFYRHADEGADDMPAHIKTMLTSVSLSIPIVDGRPALGTWQTIYLIEHRAGAHRRRLTLHYLGL